MKNKVFIFMVLVCASFLLSGCDSCWNSFKDRWDRPAEAKRIGYGCVQYDKGVYFVEIDSVRYAPTNFYAKGSNALFLLEPEESLKVTCFCLHGDNEIICILGDCSEEFLNELFYADLTPVALIFLIPTIVVAILVFGLICGWIYTKIDNYKQNKLEKAEQNS